MIRSEKTLTPNPLRFLMTNKLNATEFEYFKLNHRYNFVNPITNKNLCKDYGI